MEKERTDESVKERENVRRDCSKEDPGNVRVWDENNN